MAKLSSTTVKRLFAVSGNRCAFPGCKQSLVVGDTLIGEICHIKASRKAGPRYDLSQNDVERNAFDNLVLLCPTHHRIVDTDLAYTVKSLSEMKVHHESQSRESFQVSDAIVRKLVPATFGMALGLLVASVLDRSSKSSAQSAGGASTLGAAPGMKHTGTVSRLVEPRPFGFIKPDNSSHDFIFHAGDLHGIMIEELREGDAVEYELKGTDGYISSVNITRK